jgi:phosphoribosylanthranilate isomerase
MTRVKICGITRSEDARLAAELGAWAIGLVFHGPSPRAVDLDDAEQIGGELRRSLEVVGVFFNTPLDELAAIADVCPLTVLQLHGDEGTAYCREAARRTGAKVMKAARVKDAAAVQALRAFRDVDYHLLDAHVPGTPGGTGETFRWELAKQHRGRVPVVLSGGLTSDNVGEAIAQVKPFGVDTASGTEAAPGRKDPAKLEAFFRAVERADAGQAAA